MKSAKQVKDETDIDRYIKEKLTDIEAIIEIHKELGYAYAKYNGLIPAAIQEMLIELGYTLIKNEDMFSGKITWICWGNTPDDGGMKCN